MAQLKIVNIETKVEYVIEAKKNGENQMTCPECSHTRKKSTEKCFSFNTLKKVGRCSHCSASFVEKQDVFTIVESQVYKKPTWKNKTDLTDKVVKWFENERKITQETLKHFKVSEGLEWMPQTQKEMNTIQFNYFRGGELVNIKYRTGGKDFKLFSGAELIFYNIDSVIGAKEIVICEGEIDCITIHQCGITSVISVPNGAGASNLTYLDSAINLFGDDTTFIIAVDNDDAGNKLEQELVRRLGSENCKRVVFKDCKDANECLVKYGANEVLTCFNSPKEYPLHGIFTAKDINDDINDFYENGLPQGCGININEFDELLKFHLGYITTITGIPNMGKSEVLDFIITRLNILHGWKFALYSPENHPLQLHFSKFAEKFIGKRFDKTNFNRMTTDDLELMKQHFNNNLFFIKPEEDFTLDSILKSVKALVRKHGVNAFVIDAWNKVEHKWTNNETQYISKELDRLSMFCEKNNVHLFLVAHPTKLQKDKKSGEWEVPTLYSINGSAHFFNKTANGIVVGRDGNGLTEVHIQKVKFKHWGQQGVLKMAWNRDNGRYYIGTPDNNNWLVSSPTNEPIEYIDTAYTQGMINARLGDVQNDF